MENAEWVFLGQQIVSLIDTKNDEILKWLCFSIITSFNSAEPPPEQNQIQVEPAAPSWTKRYV